MPAERFVKLPVAVLDDTELSLEAKTAYAILVSVADREDRTAVRISLHGLAQRLQRSRDSARRMLRELLKRGHLEIHSNPIGRCPTYRLTHSTDATGTHSADATGQKSQPIAAMPPAHSTDATGTHSADATLRKRNVNGFNLDNVRTAAKGRDDGPGDALLEILFELGWDSEKIRREMPVIYQTIGGRNREHDLIAELQRARTDPSIRKPFAYALSRFRAA